MCNFEQNMKEMNRSVLRIIASTLFVAGILSACGSKHNKIKFEDPNRDNKEVYGNIGGEPLTVETPSKPDAAVGEISKEAAPKFKEQIEATVQK
jgi:hypothetical protein